MQPLSFFFLALDVQLPGGRSTSVNSLGAGRPEAMQSFHFAFSSAPSLHAKRVTLRFASVDYLREFPRGFPGGSDCSPNFFARVFSGRRVRLLEFNLFFNKRGLLGFSQVVVRGC